MMKMHPHVRTLLKIALIVTLLPITLVVALITISNLLNLPAVIPGRDESIMIVAAATLLSLALFAAWRLFLVHLHHSDALHDRYLPEWSLIASGIMIGHCSLICFQTFNCTSMFRSYMYLLSANLFLLIPAAILVLLETLA